MLCGLKLTKVLIKTTNDVFTQNHQPYLNMWYMNLIKGTTLGLRKKVFLLYQNESCIIAYINSYT